MGGPGRAFARGRVIPDLVLLDRDGTISAPAVGSRYVMTAADAELLPGAATAVGSLNRLSVPVVVVTNQRGLATGDLTSSQVDEVHEGIRAALAAAGAHIDGWYVCPHDAGVCQCRKPKPGLLARALEERPGAAIARCVVIGDSESDVLAGQALGISGILLSADARVDTVAIAVHASLPEAVAWLLRNDVDLVSGNVR
ncbi:MAG: HAD-IIIA family hydrolase [Sporichthyaceae bacterium]